MPLLCPQPQSLTALAGHYRHQLPQLRSQLQAYLLGQSPLADVAWESIAALPPEGYELCIEPERLLIRTSSPQGYFYGVQTLKQLLRQQPDALACMHIQDQPAFANRGVLYDISRDRVPHLSQLQQLIDLWAELKYNQLQLYMEAAFAYEGHEVVWQDRSPLTPGQLRTLDDYCQARGIELIANQNCFGHMEQWLDRPQYQHLAEQTQGCLDPSGNLRQHSFCLNPTQPESISFVAELLDQLLPNLRSRWLNINADETFDLGQGASQAACQALGKGQVYVNFVNQLIALGQSRGKNIQLWADILLHYPELLSQLTPGCTLLNWGYEAQHPFDQECAALAKAKQRFYVVASNSTFASLCGRWRNCRDNILNAHKQALRHGACGFYLSEWGDFGHAQPYIAGLPGYLLGACAAWQTSGLAEVDVKTSLQALYLPQPELCQALFTLADLYLATDTADQLPGVSIFGALLFNQTTNRHMKKIKRWSVAGFELALAQAEGCVQHLENCPASANEEAFTLQELLLTAKLARHACRLGLCLAQQADFRISLLSPEVRQSLADDLAPLLPQYSQVWLLASRPGGLNDSRWRLEFLLGRYLGTKE